MLVRLVCLLFFLNSFVFSEENFKYENNLKGLENPFGMYLEWKGGKASNPEIAVLSTLSEEKDLFFPESRAMGVYLNESKTAFLVFNRVCKD